MRLWLRTSVSLVTGGILFAVFLYFVDVPRILMIFGGIGRTNVTLLLVLGFITSIFYSFVYHYAFQHIERAIAYLPFLSTHLQGNFLKRINPVGEFGGEFFMAYVYKRQLYMPYSRAFGVIFASNVFNTVTSIAFVTVGFFFLLDTTLLRISSYVYSPVIFAVLFFGVLYMLYFDRDRIERLAVWGLRRIRIHSQERVRAVQTSLQQFYSVLDQALERWQFVVRVQSFSILAQLGDAALVFFALQLFGVAVPFLGLMFVVPVSFLATHLPMPGGLGGADLVMAGAVHVILGVPIGPAASAVLLFRLFSFWLPVLLGGMIMGFKAIGR